MDLGHIVERAGQQFGERVLLTDSAGTVTYAEFEQRTRRVAAALLARGLGPDQRVAIVLPNGVGLLELLYGVVRAGLIAVPIDARRASGASQVIADAGARLVCTTASICASLEVGAEIDVVVVPDEYLSSGSGGLDALISADAGAPPVARSDSDLAVLLYTSGTTGEPKGVMLTHRNWLYAALGLVHALDIARDDIALLATPLTHASGFLFLAHLLRGGRAVLLPRWDPAAFLAKLAEHRATTAFLVPTMLYGLLETPGLAAADLSSLRVLYYSSAPIDPRRLQLALDRFGSRLAQTYGLIEAPMPATVLDLADHQRIVSSGAAGRLLTSAGRESLLAEIAILDEVGSPVAGGRSGEVIVRGPHVMQGYWNQPDATAQVLRDGWLRTGDIGYQDDEGYLYLTDRKADIIVSGGASISAGHIERMLAKHPAVGEVVVVAAPDAYWGEVPVAVIVPRAGSELTPREMMEFGRVHLSGADRPKRVIIEHSLPRNDNGKLLRRRVRERFWEGRDRLIN